MKEGAAPGRTAPEPSFLLRGCGTVKGLDDRIDVRQIFARVRTDSLKAQEWELRASLSSEAAHGLAAFHGNCR